MRVLVGICGIGNGHLNRQSCVVSWLLENKHEVVIATTNNAVNQLKSKFENIKIVNISIPWISCDESGINFRDCLEKYKSNKIDHYLEFLKFCTEVEKNFSGVPDLVITDYEPNVAQYSYAVDIPLICMEQQSKFMYLKEMKIDNFSILEEKKRLNYFFPKYDYKIISSFFPIEINDEKIKVVSPIISQLRELPKKKNHVLVYFSPYDNSDKYIKILKILKEIKNYSFVIYSKENFDFHHNNNLTFKQYSNDFKQDLENAYCLISTAGHQLISEALSLNIPAYLIPLETYEQNYNANIIQKYELGSLSKKIIEKEILTFLSNIQFYVNNIQEFKKKNYVSTWQEELQKVIKKYNNRFK